VLVEFEPSAAANPAKPISDKVRAHTIDMGRINRRRARLRKGIEKMKYIVYSEGGNNESVLLFGEHIPHANFKELFPIIVSAGFCSIKENIHRNQLLTTVHGGSVRLGLNNRGERDSELITRTLNFKSF
jgi:hypothetical protein